MVDDKALGLLLLVRLARLVVEAHHLVCFGQHVRVDLLFIWLHVLNFVRLMVS
jgi:hypothetical protein